MGKLADAYYQKHHAQIGRSATELLAHLGGDQRTLSAVAATQAARAANVLTDTLGYSADSARDLVGMVVSARYRST